ncbi:MAG: hypothetical protein CM1200mP9_10560 [Gammaproteobacteria bacterium]|nr:MAG: hypothetical protein CM1200mP9_10560 [Gammaproteobacteria bacterium]
MQKGPLSHNRVSPGCHLWVNTREGSDTTNSNNSFNSCPGFDSSKTGNAEGVTSNEEILDASLGMDFHQWRK